MIIKNNSMRYKILIIEDEIINLNILKHILKNDYDVITAQNGKKGFELYHKMNPHVIITDLKMPEMNGIELIKKIRTIDQNLIIIVTTSADVVPTLLEASELKLFKYLLKPIDSTELRKVVIESIDASNAFYTIALDNIKISEELFWKRDNFELRFQDKIVKLTPKEKKLLNWFLLKPNITFQYDQIIYDIWEKENEQGDRKTLKTLVTSLRKKHEKIQIDNVYGFGYKIVLLDTI